MDPEEIKKEIESNFTQFFGKDGNAMPVYKYKGHNILYLEMASSALSKLNTVKFRPDDVLLYTYPGTGAHWMYEITNMILAGNSKRTSVIKEDVILDMAPVETLESVKSPRLLSSHLSLELIPPELLQNHKIIYVNRNPKAVILTYYRHLKQANTFEYNGDFPSYFDLHMKGEVPYGDYFKHTQEFYTRYHDKPNVLNVTYEEMTADLSKIVSRVAKFLGKTVSDELRESIVEMCTFDKMKADEKIQTNYYPEDGFKEGATYYHSGKLDTWKKWLTVEQSERVDARVQTEFSEQGIKLNI
ncbi:sulfotransferase 1E1 [Octopus sinensis]|uniref:Sulfotransferase 1E1 n=1 Tax=Octopus sinensis TaxID=2607531 RepID=A0A6P7S7S0_9MOLL|nr:sulfotransferase 1E1 [Octopus sinensis]